MVVVVFLIIGTTLWGVAYSFGIFFKSLESEFNLTRTATSAIFSTQMLFGIIFTILGGWALDKYGPRIVIFLMGLFTGLSAVLTGQINSLWQLFMTYSLLLSMGTSAIYVIVVSTVSRWFDKKRGLALGIAISGAGLGTVIVAPIATSLISAFSWRIAYSIIGAVTCLIVLPLSFLLRKDPYEIGTLPDATKTNIQDIKNVERIPSAGLSLSQAFRTRSFWLLISIWFFFAINIFLVITHIVPHITDVGFSASMAAYALSLIGISNAGSRVLMGIVCDRIGRKLTASICVLLQAGALVWLIWAHELWMLYLFALVYGFAWGGTGPAMGALIADVFGMAKIGSVLGVLDSVSCLGAAIGPAMGGFIFDVTKSYSWAFLFLVVALFIVVVSITLIRREAEIFDSSTTSEVLH